MSFRILSLSGGGYLGYFSVLLAEELENQAGRPLARSFDLVSGTSIGGILALMLAAEVPPAEMLNAFKAQGSAIFSTRERPNGMLGDLRSLAGALAGPKYEAKALKSGMADLLGKKKLGDLAKPVVIPVVDTSDGSARLFASYKEEDAELKAVDVGLATAAVPAFYPLVEIQGRYYADGGLFANSPDLLALSEAEAFLGADMAETSILSLGTTTAHFPLPEPVDPAMGVMAWMFQERLARLTIAAQQSANEQVLRRWLGERFVRLDARPTPEDISATGLDVATPTARAVMERLAKEVLAENADNSMLRNILAARD